MFPKYEYRDEAMRVFRGSRQGGYPLRFHKHVEIAYIADGFADITIDKQAYTLQQGDIYIVFPNLVHSIEHSNAIKYMVLISPELLTALCDTLSRFKPVCPVLRSEDSSPFLEQLFRHMHELYRKDHRQHYTTLVCHANALLSELIQELELEERKSDSELVQQLVIYLLNNYTEEISLDTVAAELGYSKYHISHVIADTFGCNFRTLVNSYRISMAQNLLLSTTHSISEVAYACGFKNQSSFNRIFLERCGITPSIFRHNTEEIPTEPQLYLK